MAQDIISIESILFNENLETGSAVTYQGKPLVVVSKRANFGKDGSITEFSFRLCTQEEYEEVVREIIVDEVGEICSDLTVSSHS